MKTAMVWTYLKEERDKNTAEGLEMETKQKKECRRSKTIMEQTNKNGNRKKSLPRRRYT